MAATLDASYIPKEIKDVPVDPALASELSFPVLLGILPELEPLVVFVFDGCTCHQPELCQCPARLSAAAHLPAQRSTGL